MKRLGKLLQLTGSVLFAAILLAGCDGSSVVNDLFPNYDIGGEVKGLDGTLTLTLNNGVPLELTKSGRYTFPAKVKNNTGYEVVIKQQPATQDCSPQRYSGTVNSVAVGNLDFTCNNVPVHFIKGQVEGIEGASISLTLNEQTDQRITLTESSDYIFENIPLKEGASYQLSLIEPADYSCSVTNQAELSGQVAQQDVVINFNCIQVQSFSLGGTVQGLKQGNSLTLNLQYPNNPTQTKTLTQTGSGDLAFQFDDPIKEGAEYSITLTDPTDQACQVMNDPPPTIDQDRSDALEVKCENTFAVSVNITGLDRQLELLLYYGPNNKLQSNKVTTNKDGNIVLPVRLKAGTQYQLGLKSTIIECRADNGAGTGIMADQDLSIPVTCRIATARLNDLTFPDIKTFGFSWANVDDANHYILEEDPDGAEGPAGYSQLAQITAQQDTTLSYQHRVPLHERLNAQYLLSTCYSGDATDCHDGTPLVIDTESKAIDHLVDAIGYVKASDTKNAGDSDQFFGYSISLTDDGTWLAVGAPQRDLVSSSTEKHSNAGAVYLYHYTPEVGWLWQTKLLSKAPTTGGQFGVAVSLSGDGSYLAVGETGRNSSKGAAHIYQQDDSNNWQLATTLTATNADKDDHFGTVLSFNKDGTTVAIAAPDEDSKATGVNGKQDNNGAEESGAVYIVERDPDKSWSAQASLHRTYIKAAVTETSGDNFGLALSLSGDGSTLAVGAPFNDNDEESRDSGAAFLYRHTPDQTDRWQAVATITVNNAAGGLQFGSALSLNEDASVLAVTAWHSDDSGSVYLYRGSAQSASWGFEQEIRPEHLIANSGFANALSLSNDGTKLAIGGSFILMHRGTIRVSSAADSSSYTGIQAFDVTASLDGGKPESGAAYLYKYASSGWQPELYIKAPNTDGGDHFGVAIALSADGGTLAVGAISEDSQYQVTAGVPLDSGKEDPPTDDDPNPRDKRDNNGQQDAGAVYLY